MFGLGLTSRHHFGYHDEVGGWVGVHNNCYTLIILESRVPLYHYGTLGLEDITY